MKLVRLIGVLRCKSPARERFGKSLDFGLGVGRDGFSVTARFGRPVDIQLHQPDGEQLQHLAGIVFIGVNTAISIVLLAFHHIQVVPHGGVQRHFLQQCPVVAKSIAIEHVYIRRHGIGPDVWRNVGNHHDLGQSKGHTPAQLIRTLQPLLPNGFITHLFRSPLVAVPGFLHIEVTGMQQGRRLELRPHPVLEPLHPQRFNVVNGFGAKTGLSQKPGCILRSGSGIDSGTGRLCSRRSKGDIADCTR